MSVSLRMPRPDPADPTTEDDRLLVSARDLARMLSVSLATVRRLDSAARLPRPVRLAGSVRWRADEIRRWCEAGCPERRTWETMTHDG